MADPRRVLKFPNLPDSVLIEKLCEYGQVRRHARAAMDSPQLKLFATIFYFDTIEAENGDREAKARVDYCREQWQKLRQGERALGNNPELGAKTHVLNQPHPL